MGALAAEVEAKAPEVASGPNPSAAVTIADAGASPQPGSPSAWGRDPRGDPVSLPSNGGRSVLRSVAAVDGAAQEVQQASSNARSVYSAASSSSTKAARRPASASSRRPPSSTGKSASTIPSPAPKRPSSARPASRLPASPVVAPQRRRVGPRQPQQYRQLEQRRRRTRPASAGARSHISNGAGRIVTPASLLSGGGGTRTPSMVATSTHAASVAGDAVVIAEEGANQSGQGWTSGRKEGGLG